MESKKIYKPKTKEELNDLIVHYHFNRGIFDLNDIDTSEITDMSELFCGYMHDFNVSEWNTENVVNMKRIFDGCSQFNSDISSWNVGKVKDMCGMFLDCPSFNCDLSKWDVSSVEDMSWMFYDCTSFNQDLRKWNMRNRDYIDMFDGCLIKDEWKPKYIDLYEESESV